MVGEFPTGHAAQFSNTFYGYELPKLRKEKKNKRK
jgi:hypothetical protein